MLRSVSRRSPLLSRPSIRPRAPAAYSRGCPSWLILKAESLSTLVSPHRDLARDPGPSVPSTSALRAAPPYLGRVGGSGLLAGPRHPPSAYPAYTGSPLGHVRGFHATPKRDFNPLPVLAAVLKSSTALEFARMVARVGLTFVPLLLLGNMRSKKWLQHGDKMGHPNWEEKKASIERKIRTRTIWFHILIFTPLILYWATIVASLERTPLTGRWRVILLSPEEEEEIAAQLAGPGWYRAVGEILSAEGTPRIIPPSDWRLVWVRDTLRRLESVIPTLAREAELCPHWIDCGPDDIPLPPPADYPLRPRPRASEQLHRFAEMSCARTYPPAAHAIAGPPYSLLLVDRPDSSNAFSYGFGPDGGGGVVVFSGFIDEVLSKYPAQAPPEPPPQSFWARVFGIRPAAPPHPIPTPEQTAELATLLAHELAHLVLSHHIETLSSGSIVWPSVMSIVTDSLRAFLFPFTMLFGPFINDALAGMWKAGAGEFSQLQEYCTSQKQEVEADVVSIRLLAHAGFDPRQAVRFWEHRADTPQTAECSPARAGEQAEHDASPAVTMARRMVGDTHPVHEVRVSKLKEELNRWEQARQAARAAREKEQQRAQAQSSSRP
ncbi:peptidase family M48-domain-containing protein [Cerioporus squamosus]|nr:peptidase family M48-domain-containing protein [Cerioporus squamosus]